MTFIVDSDLNGESPQFTLTCTSTGGPATTVTWTRDSETVSGGMTELDDPVTAQYTHTLTVTGRLGGQYQCNVSNNKQSTATAQLTVEGEREQPEYMYSRNSPQEIYRYMCVSVFSVVQAMPLFRVVMHNICCAADIVHPHLYLHRWPCYYCHLDQRL